MADTSACLTILGDLPIRRVRWCGITADGFDRLFQVCVRLKNAWRSRRKRKTKMKIFDDYDEDTSQDHFLRKIMLVLDQSLWIGRGNNRACFRHPESPDRCIKVDRADGKDAAISQNQIEAAYYKKLRRIRPNYDYDGIPRYFGTQPTSQGTGYVFERIANKTDGVTSPTIGRWLQTRRSGDEMMGLFDAITRMRENLIDQAIPVRDLGPDNVCVQELSQNHYRIVAIDCVGHRDFVALVDYWPWFARRKIQRHLTRHGWFAEPSQSIQIC